MKKYYWCSGHTKDGVLYADSVKADDREQAIELFVKMFPKEEFEDLSVEEEHAEMFEW